MYSPFGENLFYSIDFELILHLLFSATVKAMVPQQEIEITRGKVICRTTVRQEVQKHFELYISNAATRLKRKN